MKRKHTIISLAIILSLIVSESFFGSNHAISYSSGPPPSRSGSPGDGGNNCTSCHTGTATGVTGWITSNIPITGYVPGSTYSITLTATGTTQTRFGFQATSEKDSDNTKTGTPIITNTTATQIMGTDWVEHKSAGTTGSTGSHTWSYDWIAPLAGTGNISFYAAFLVTNNSGTSAGDSVYTSSLSITENVPAIANVFINEIHYDNAGADSLEGVEIAGDAGIDLSCYDIVLYNGSGGASYKTETLSGTLTNQACGYGTIWFPITSVQNGSPDGIALYNTCSSTLVQFLSYEGTFTATNGIASGISSTDIGISESSSTVGGFSLQLTGSGTTYSDFSWSGIGQNTYNSVNTNQDFGTISLLTSNDAFLCEGDSITITAFASGGAPPYTYFWDNGLSSDTSHSVSPSITTTYTVYATDSANCPSSIAQFAISVSSIPQLTTSSDTSICEGSSIDISATVSGGTSPYTYNWSNGLGSSSSHTISPSNNINYTVSIIDAVSCESDTNTIAITVFPTPSINSDSLIIASSSCGNNDGSITGLSVSGGTLPYTYNWADSTNSNIGSSIDLANIGSGLYTMTLTDSNGCTALSDNILVSNNTGSFAVAANPDTAICQLDSAILTANASGGAAPYTYFWNNGLSNSETHVVAPTITTNYIVYAEDTNGCQTSSDTINILVSSTPTANFTAFSSGLNATFSNSTTGGVIYLWDFDDGSTSTEQDPNHSFANDGTYNVCLTATSSENCSATICKDISITVTGITSIASLNQPFIYPNPSKNGQFNIVLSNYTFREDALFLVYNMQGEKVYQKNIGKILYDQRIHLPHQSEGIYFYKITDQGNAFNGKLTIIK